MSDKLYIIGNGLDIAHNLPTKFDPDFKRIADKHEIDHFWNIYQSREDSIWADFENLLGTPDFNCLEDIFDGYEPDYSSEHEYDRDSIITQVHTNGLLQEELTEFVNNAEKAMNGVKPKDSIKQIIDSDGYYITFNYTHTLEKIYRIPQNQVLHIHGEAGHSNMLLGYPEGDFSPEKYLFDARKKGRGPYAEMDIADYINNKIEDTYVRNAYLNLLEKCESFSKPSRMPLLKGFLNDHNCKIDEIIVYGHSCAIDFEYFRYLNRRYPNAQWRFYIKGDKQKNDVNKLIFMNNIGKTSIIEIMN